MLELKIKWSDPYSYKTEYGIWWKRDWLIEKEYLSLFFNYWRQNSFKLKDKGYGVTKKDEGWYLYETKPEKHLFKEYEHLKPIEKQSEFILNPIEVKTK